MNAILRRRRALMQMQSSPTPGGLPSEYQRVEWIEANVGPAINTEVSGTLNTKIVCKMRRVDYEPSNPNSFPALFGQDSPILTHTFGRTNDNNYVSFGNKTDQSYNENLRSAFHVIEVDKAAVIVDGVTKKTYSGTTFTPNTSRHIFIFGRCSKNNTLERQSYTRCAYFQIYQDGSLVCDLIPCYRKSDSVIGMYDLIQRVFRTNIGSGTFSKGQDL